ncbi:MAG: sulfatase-like hydrolase/transferase [Alphaproteobacteria bacterium]|nr:sulfatase-like hydrolase/transferase [Alphaproteobacteria bacterium]
MPALLLLLLACTCSSRKPDAPDVVLILVDTLRADALGYAGNPRPATPQIDALVAAEATWFSRAYACSSWTLSSTTSLLTGTYPWTHGVVRAADNPDQFGRLGDALPSVATTLGQRGYRTGAFINNAFLAPEFGLNQGFGTYDYQGADPRDHRSAQATVDAALAWIDAAPTEPAFLLVHLMEPHFDYAPPATHAGMFSAGLPHALPGPPFGDQQMVRWLNRIDVPSVSDQAYVRAVYDEEVRVVDDAVAALVAGLRARGRWADATAVFTADHGEEFWDYGGFEHGHTTRSAVTRVPLWVKAPGVPAGRNDSVVDHVAVHALLTTGGGPVRALAEQGTLDPDRVAFTQDILYGPQQVGAVDRDRRLLVHLDTGTAELWGLDAEGREVEALHLDPARRAEGQGLVDALTAQRGGWAPTPARNPRLVEDAETFEKLRELGYLE